MEDQYSRKTRVRYTALGAAAALAAAGAIAGTAALAKSPTTPPPTKAPAPQSGSDQPFLAVVARLVNDGTISGAEGQALDRAIATGGVDSQTLAAEGFSPAQIQAAQQALANAKRALAPETASHIKAPVPAGAGTKSPAPPGAIDPFVSAIQALVNDGTITRAQGQTVDRAIQAGSVDPPSLARAGFTQTQIQAVNQTLERTKRGLAP